MESGLLREDSDPFPPMGTCGLRIDLVFVCSVCGYRSLKYFGRCPNCGEWGTMKPEEEVERKGKVKEKVPIVRLEEVEEGKFVRFSTGTEGLDRVLGGGIVSGSVILLSGNPGVGKSTLFLQVAGHLVREGRRVLLVSAEESAVQVKHRAKRMGIPGEVLVAEGENLDRLLSSVPKGIDVLMVDSIQSIYTEDLNSPAGSISQVRFCADRLFRFAKERGVAVLMSGHVTKTGNVAGPKALEHVVDVVLYLEGERGSPLRMLRAHKNRFGPTDEVAFFQMTERGLIPIEDPTLFFASPGKWAKVGVAYGVITKGSVRLVVEVQSLIHYSYYPVPVRYSVGYDPKRLAIILALIEKRLDIKVGKRDVYLNVSGGFKIDEPYGDMAVAASLLSSLRNAPLDNAGVFIGEISLSGDFRSPPDLPLRVGEARRLGFRRVYAPTDRQFEGITLVPVKDIKALGDVM